MTMPTSPNAISFGQLQTEYGGSSPITLSEYYNKGNAPASGAIILGSHFHGTSNSVLLNVTVGKSGSYYGYFNGQQYFPGYGSISPALTLGGHTVTACYFFLNAKGDNLFFNISDASLGKLDYFSHIVIDGVTYDPSILGTNGHFSQGTSSGWRFNVDSGGTPVNGTTWRNSEGLTRQIEVFTV